MLNRLNEQAKHVLALAADEARALNHQYVGTEHVLLGLCHEGSGIGDVLARLRLTPDVVRAEVEKLVQRGPDTPRVHDLPLTPRAKRAIQIAGEEAAVLSLSQIGPEQLLVGLILEADGVAGLVMRNLGLTVRQVGTEAFKTRLLQMRIVERAVRPARAGIKHKRKMREELLAHLGEIYQEELTRLNATSAAMDAASVRFGDPAALAGELDVSVPVSERIAYYFERWLAWRAPESVAHMMARTSLMSMAIIALLMGVPIVVGMIIQGWDATQIAALRVFAALLLLTPASQFMLGVSYYKLRDSMWGVFGSKRSLVRVTQWGFLIALIVLATGVAFTAAVAGPALGNANGFPVMAIAGIVTAVLFLISVRISGPVQIRDTIWGLLDLETTS